MAYFFMVSINAISSKQIISQPCSNLARYSTPIVRIKGYFKPSQNLLLYYRTNLHFLSQMIKRKLSEADWFLIVANLLPVYGVWFQNWNAKEVFLVYCLETIIIGFFTLVKLGIVTAIRKSDWWESNGSKTMMSGLFFMLFFIAHYGLFVGVQTSIFFSFTSVAKEGGPSNIVQFLLHPNKYLGTEGWLLICAFVFSYGYENLIGFILNNEYRAKSFARIMFEPYMRIFVQQFTVILGSFVLMFGADKIFILVFAIAKIFFTVVVNYEAALANANTKSNYQESNNSHS